MKKGGGGKYASPPLKYLVLFHHSILFQIPLLSPRLLIPSSVKSVLFLLPPPPFLACSRDSTKHNLIPVCGVGSVATTVVIPLRTARMQVGESEGRADNGNKWELQKLLWVGLSSIKWEQCSQQTWIASARHSTHYTCPICPILDFRSEKIKMNHLLRYCKYSSHFKVSDRLSKKKIS